MTSVIIAILIFIIICQFIFKMDKQIPNPMNCDIINNVPPQPIPEPLPLLEVNVSKEEILAKANEVIEHRKYLQLCDDAFICPRCGTKLSVDNTPLNYGDGFCSKCNYREKSDYINDED